MLVGILFFEFLVVHWQLLFLGKWLGSKDVVVELSLCNEVSVSSENHKSSPNLDKDFSVFKESGHVDPVEEVIDQQLLSLVWFLEDLYFRGKLILLVDVKESMRAF